MCKSTTRSLLRVQKALNAKALDVHDIRVDTSRGVVKLSGFAWDRQNANHAEATTRKIAGVVDVKNEIVLRRADNSR